MAEFDTSGFSAVASFFGGSAANGKSEKARNESASSPVSTTSRGRRGVGATLASPSVQNANEHQITKSLLRVGNRKRGDLDEDNFARSDSDSDEHEEEGGRTSIQEKTTRQEAPEVNNIAVPKKKPGRKERKRATVTVQEENAVDTHNTEGEQNEVESKDTGKSEENDISQQEVQETKQKRKRRKIRSRQKNIYKDKRLAQHKPDHLIPGRPNFQGRPMTAETRARLKLPPSKSSRKHHDGDNEQDSNDANDNGGVNLAVDSFLKDDTDQDIGVDANPKQIPKKKHKKRKKSKYKNLR